MKKVTLLSTAAAICGLVSFQSAYADTATPELTLTADAQWINAPSIAEGENFQAPADIDAYFSYTGNAKIRFSAKSNDAAAKVAVSGLGKLTNSTNDEIPYTMGYTIGGNPKALLSATGGDIAIGVTQDKAVVIDLDITNADLTGLPKSNFSNTLTLTLSVV